MEMKALSSCGSARRRAGRACCGCTTHGLECRRFKLKIDERAPRSQRGSYGVERVAEVGFGGAAGAHRKISAVSQQRQRAVDRRHQLLHLQHGKQAGPRNQAGMPDCGVGSRWSCPPSSQILPGASSAILSAARQPGGAGQSACVPRMRPGVPQLGQRNPSPAALARSNQLYWRKRISCSGEKE